MNKKTTFSCVKDYDEQGKHLGEQPVRRTSECNLDLFSLRGKKPIFPEQQDVTLPLCQGKYYATLYDEKWGIARYSLYKITAKDAEKAMSNPVARPKGDPWKQTLGN